MNKKICFYILWLLLIPMKHSCASTYEPTFSVQAFSTHILNDEIEIITFIESELTSKEDLLKYDYYLANDKNSYPLSIDENIISNVSGTFALRFHLKNKGLIEGNYRFIINGENIAEKKISQSTELTLRRADMRNQNLVVKNYKINYSPPHTIKEKRSVLIETNKNLAVLMISIQSLQRDWKVYVVTTEQGYAFVGFSLGSGNFHFDPEKSYSLLIQEVLPSGKLSSIAKKIEFKMSDYLKKK